MKLFAVACRNIARNRARTWITTGAMAFAGFIMIFYAALLAGLLQTTERNAIGMDIGELQIHAPGYRQDPDLYNRINNSAAMLKKIETAGYRAAPRLYGFGLAAAGSASAGVRLRGVDLHHEPAVTQINRHILEGRWLNERNPAGIVIGRKLARTLGTDIGAEIVFVGQAADGSMANDLYTVRGILKSVGDDIDRSGFFMSAQAFRKLMILPHGVHEIVAMRQDRTINLEDGTHRLADILPELEVKNWRQLRPTVARIIDLSRSSLLIMLLVTYSAVGILTLNAMLMSVFERIHEFGIMKALGLKPWHVLALITTETLLQVSIAAVLATASAIPLAFYCQSHPLNLSFLAKASANIAGIAIDPVWYCRITAESILAPLLFMYAVALAAIIYPAGKAALIRPIKAIYY